MEPKSSVPKKSSNSKLANALVTVAGVVVSLRELRLARQRGEAYFD
jgi:hypothetical protein